MSKQTAVKWLIDEIEKHYIINNARLDPTIIMELEKQAKSMEREQMENNWKDGVKSDNGHFGTFEKYYNDIYK